MAAYAALVSVMQIIDQLERHPSPPISIDKQQVESLTEIVTFLQDFLEGYDSSVAYSDEADPLEMRMADAAYAAEVVIESYIVDNIQLRRSTSTHHPSWNRLFNCDRDNKEASSHGDAAISCDGEESRRWNNFCRDLHKVIEDMDRIKEVVMEMMRKKTAVQADQPQRSNIFRSSSLTGKNSIMEGVDDVFLQLLEKVTSGTRARQVIPITGMGGIGKTTLARNIFENALVKETFDVCAWVTISQQYNMRDIIFKILSQLTRKSDNRDKSEEELGQEFLSEKDLGVEVHKYLYGRKYLIIIDDIWSVDAWEEMKSYFGDCKNGSRIVVTTRQSYLTSHFTDSYALNMKFLDEDSSWNLFSKTVFGKESFPLQLEKIGKKIVENCRGLPLSIVVIGGLLAKSKHTQEYWENIEEKLNSIVNSENHEYCLKVLKLSYDNLPAYLKPSFLYMGIFEEDKRIRVSVLIKLWVSEGFLKPEKGKSLEMIGKGFLKDLIDRNLILIDELGSIGNIKYCKIHDLLRDFCLKQAEKERFYHMMGNHSPQGIYNRRRMFCHRRISYNALKSVSHLRSFTSQYHEFGGLSNFRLLRILNSSSYSTESPQYCLRDVIDELVNSRYVAIRTSKTKFPSSLSFLWSLQTLRIGHKGGKIMAPVEIWMMSQLRHVEFFGGICFPDPPSGNSDSRVILENLQTLEGVRNFKCGEEVVKRIPNILRLQIVYEEVPKIGRHGDYYCLSNIGCLRKLESLTFRTSGDYFLQNLTFPQSLKKLVLCSSVVGSLIGWEEILEKIGSLPILQKLKLFRGHFRSGKWKTVEGHFLSLKSLSLMSLMSLNLKEWTIEESSHFPCLEHLNLHGLSDLEIPLEIGEIATLQSIDLILCSESTVKSAKKIVEVQEELQGDHLPFHVRVVVKKEQEALRSLANPNFQVIVL